MEPRNKLFVGGYFSIDITEDTLRDHFSSYGEVKESLIIRDKNTGLPRGFGFVTFTDAETATRALQDKHLILGQKVDVKYARPMVGKNQERNDGLVDDVRRNNNDRNKNNNKIYVGGLPPDLKSEELKEYFEKYGEIDEAFVVINKRNGGKSRGFGFVSFETEEALEAALKERQQVLRSKQVEVKRAVARSGIHGPRNNFRLYETYYAYHEAPYYVYPFWYYPSYVYPWYYDDGTFYGSDGLMVKNEPAINGSSADSQS